MIRGFCSACGRMFNVDDRYAGMAGRCKACGAAIRVPGEPPDGLDGLPPLPSDQPQGLQWQQPVPPRAAAPPPPQTVPPAGKPPAPQMMPPDRDPLRPHDSRSRYEPPHGPTTLGGSWLKEEPAEPAPAPPAPGEGRALDEGHAEEMLSSGRIVTEVGPEQGAYGRPKLITLACVLLGLLAACFFLHLVTLGLIGAAGAAIAAILAGMAMLRLWAGHMDGLVPAVLLCLCVAGGALLPSQFPQANIAFLAAAGVVFLLLLLIAMLPSTRQYFTPSA